MTCEDRKALKEKYGDERVFVVPAQDADRCIAGRQGLIPAHEGGRELVTDLLELTQIMERYNAEYNPDVRQLVVYSTLADYDGKLFAVRKIVCKEERLRGKLTVCFGGHMNENDFSLYVCLNRELREELGLDNFYDYYYRGVITDTTDSVGSDHIGFVFYGQVDPSRVKIIDKDSAEGIWLSIRELIDLFGELDTWSKYIVKDMVDISVARKRRAMSYGEGS